MNTQELIVKAYSIMESLKDLERDDIADRVLPLLNLLRQYHNHTVFGLEQVPKEGSALIVCNHSFATYDIACLLGAIYEEHGRYTRSLIDRAFFKIPGLGEVMEFMGSVQGNQTNAQSLLTTGELLTVAPGGMREALKPSQERYQIKWDKRKGFAKLAMQTRAPIILAACPKADDLFDIYPSKLTSWVYKNFKMPFVFASGIGPTPLPKPVVLTHFLSEAITPPELPESEADQRDAVAKFHTELVDRMHELINAGIHYTG